MAEFYESPFKNNPYDTSTGLARRTSGRLDGPSLAVATPGQMDLVDPDAGNWLAETTRSHAQSTGNDFTNGIEYLARGLAGDTEGRTAAANEYLRVQEQARAMGPAIQSFEDAEAAGGGAGDYGASLAYMAAGMVPDIVATATGIGTAGTIARRGVRTGITRSIADGIEAQAGNAARRSMAGSVGRSEARAAAAAAGGGPEAVSGAVRVATRQANEASRKAAMGEAVTIAGRTPRLGIGADTAEEALTRGRQQAIQSAGDWAGRAGGTAAAIPGLNGSANAEKAADAETSTADMWALAAGTTAAAATQVVPVERFLGKFGSQAKADVAARAEKFLPRATREALKQGSLEGGQEVVQQALQNASHAYVEDNLDTLIGPKAFDQYLTSLLAGSILGGAMGGGGEAARSLGGGVSRAASWSKEKGSATYNALREKVAAAAQARRDRQSTSGLKPGDPVPPGYDGEAPEGTPNKPGGAGDYFKRGLDAARGFATAAGGKATNVYNAARDKLKQNEDLDSEIDDSTMAIIGDVDVLFGEFESGRIDPVTEPTEATWRNPQLQEFSKLGRTLAGHLVTKDTPWDEVALLRPQIESVEKLFSGSPDLSAADWANIDDLRQTHPTQVLKWEIIAKEKGDMFDAVRQFRTTNEELDAADEDMRAGAVAEETGLDSGRGGRTMAAGTEAEFDAQAAYEMAGDLDTEEQSGYGGYQSKVPSEIRVSPMDALVAVDRKPGSPEYEVAKRKAQNWLLNGTLNFTQAEKLEGNPLPGGDAKNVIKENPKAKAPNDFTTMRTRPGSVLIEGFTMNNGAPRKRGAELPNIMLFLQAQANMEGRRLSGKALFNEALIALQVADVDVQFDSLVPGPIVSFKGDEVYTITAQDVKALTQLRDSKLGPRAAPPRTATVYTKGQNRKLRATKRALRDNLVANEIDLREDYQDDGPSFDQVMGGAEPKSFREQGPREAPPEQRSDEGSNVSSDGAIFDVSVRDPYARTVAAAEREAKKWRGAEAQQPLIDAGREIANDYLRSQNEVGELSNRKLAAMLRRVDTNALQAMKWFDRAKNGELSVSSSVSETRPAGSELDRPDKKNVHEDVRGSLRGFAEAAAKTMEKAYEGKKMPFRIRGLVNEYTDMAAALKRNAMTRSDYLQAIRRVVSADVRFLKPNRDGLPVVDKAVEALSRARWRLKNVKPDPNPVKRAENARKAKQVRADLRRLSPEHQLTMLTVDAQTALRKFVDDLPADDYIREAIESTTPETVRDRRIKANAKDPQFDGTAPSRPVQQPTIVQPEAEPRSKVGPLNADSGGKPKPRADYTGEQEQRNQADKKQDRAPSGRTMSKLNQDVTPEGDVAAPTGTLPDGPGDLKSPKPQSLPDRAEVAERAKAVGEKKAAENAARQVQATDFDKSVRETPLKAPMSSKRKRDAEALDAEMRAKTEVYPDVESVGDTVPARKVTERAPREAKGYSAKLLRRLAAQDTHYRTIRSALDAAIKAHPDYNPELARFEQSLPVADLLKGVMLLNNTTQAATDAEAFEGIIKTLKAIDTMAEKLAPQADSKARDPSSLEASLEKPRAQIKALRRAARQRVKDGGLTKRMPRPKKKVQALPASPPAGNAVVLDNKVGLLMGEWTAAVDLVNDLLDNISQKETVSTSALTTLLAKLGAPAQNYLTRSEIKARGAFNARAREELTTRMQTMLRVELNSMEMDAPGSGFDLIRKEFSADPKAALTPAQKATDAFVHPLLKTEKGRSQLTSLMGMSQSNVRHRRVVISAMRGVDAGLVPPDKQVGLMSSLLAEVSALNRHSELARTDPLRANPDSEAHPNWERHDQVLEQFKNGTVDQLAAVMLEKVNAGQLTVAPFVKNMLSLVGKSRYARNLKVGLETKDTDVDDLNGPRMDVDSSTLTVSTRDAVREHFGEGAMPEAMDPVAIFVHEATHGMTMLGEAADPRLSKDLDKLVVHVRQAFDKQYGKGASTLIYGLSDTQEFLAESFSNMKFQDMLRQIPAANTESFKTAWDQFKHLVLRLLGLSTTPANFTALDEALTLGVSLMRSSAEASDAKQTYTKQFDDLGDGIEAAASTPADGHDYVAETAMVNAMAKAMGVSANLEVRSAGALLMKTGGNYDRGTRVIEVNSNLTDAERIEVLMHELGHHIVWDAVAKVVGWDAVQNMSLDQAFDVIATSNPKLYAALKADFDAYRAKHKPGTYRVRAVEASKPLQRSRRAADAGQNDDSKVGEKTFAGASGFHEWIADNIARALTTQKAPVSLIEKFFDKIAASIREVWRKLGLQRKAYRPAKSVDAWVREMFSAEAAAMKAVTGSNAPRAMVEAVTSTAMTVYQAPDRPGDFSESIGPQPAFKIEDVDGFKAAVRTMMKAEERQILTRALSTAQAIKAIRAQINEMHKNDPATRDQLLKDLDSATDGMENRIAIGYMLWSKGLLRVGPNSTSVLHGFGDDLLNFAGLAGDGDYAQRIFSDIANGTIARVHAAGRTYDVRKLEARSRGKAQKALDKVRSAYETATGPLSKVFSSQLQRMRDSGIPSMARLASMLARSSSTIGEDEGMHAAVVDTTARFLRQTSRVLEPLSLRQRVKVLSRLQRQIEPDGKQPHIDAAMKDMRAIFDQAYDYMKAAGVDVGARKNFFPIVFDQQNQRAATILNDLYLTKEKDADGKDTEAFRYEKQIREFFAKTQAARDRDAKPADAPAKPLPAANPEHLEYFNRERKSWSPKVAAVNESIIDAVTHGSIANLRTQIAASEAREARRDNVSADLEKAFYTERRYMAARIKELEEAGFAENEGSATQRTGPKATKETPFEDLVKNLVEGALNDGDQVRKPGTAPGFRGAKFRASQFIYDRGDAADIKKFASIQSKAASEIFARYFEPMVKHAEFTKRLGGGKDNRDKFDALLADLKVEGATPAQIEEAENAVAAAMGAYGVDGSPVLRMISPSLADKFSGPKTKAAVQSLQAYQNLRLLPLSILSSLVDPMGIAVRTGGDFGLAWDGFKAGMKGVLNGVSHDDQLAMLETLGSAEDMLPALAAGAGFSGQGVPAARAVNDFVFKVNGMQRWIMATRFMAMQSGHAFLLKHAAQAATSDTSRRYLAELNIEPSDIKEVWSLPSAGGGAARRTVEINDKSRAALSRFVNDSILRPHSQQVPLWYNDPYVGLVTQYKGFLYAIYEQIGGRIAREWNHGNMMVALPALAYVPVVILAELLREFIQYGLDGNPRRADWGPGDYTLMGVQRTGLLGPKQDVIQGVIGDAKAGRTVGSSQLGPALGQAKNIVEAAGGRRSITQEVENALPFNPAYKNRINPLTASPDVEAPVYIPQGT